MHMERCVNGCCWIHKRENYPAQVRWDFRHKYNRPKAGVFVHDPIEKRILLVQSRGMKWGPPKGTVEYTDDNIIDCALRELLEETGITMKTDDLVNDSVQLFQISRATYFYVMRSVCPVEPKDIDITGYTWIKTNCAKQLDLNSHCKQLLKKLE
jgi:8-oxo-dGTP pyrophosphatase MutT (NUDIX family)